jgi:hypothetical protein
MNKQTTRRVILSILPLFMIATIGYYLALRSTFYKGRHQSLVGTSPMLVASDSGTQPVVLEIPRDGGALRILEGDHWTTSSYSGWASSIVLDHQGNMWIADGENGLYRIHGKNRDSFKTGNSGLASNTAYHLAVDKRDRLWITYDYGGGLSGSGATMFDGNTWITFTTDNSGLISDEVTTIAFDPENRIWFGTTHGLSIFDGHQWVTYSPGTTGLVGENVWGIAFDKDSRAWIGTNGGLNVFDGKTWTQYPFEEIGLHSQASKIFIDHFGRIWVQGGYDVRIFDGRKWIGLATEDSYDSAASSIATDQKGNIWIANGSGLVKLDPDYPFAFVWYTQLQRIFLASGGMWYIAFILVCLFLAILRDAVMPVALAVLGGFAIFVACAVLLKDVHVVYFAPIMNPGIHATVGSMLGAFAGITNAARTGKPKGLKSTVIGLVIGLAIGICQLLPGLLAQ